MKYGITVLVVVLLIVAGIMFKKTHTDVPVQEAAVADLMPTNREEATVASTAVVVGTDQKAKTISNKRVQNGMTIEVLKEGAGVEITNNQTAVVDYVGMLTDGTVFDASARHGKSFEFPVGAGMVIKGWDQGVLGMKVGEKRKLTIPSELAYGAQGIPGVIPQNATLVFEVTLQGIK